jgi:hypothetical protein
MKTFDKINIIIAFIGTLLLFWHIFAPEHLCITGFFGWPTIVCMFFIGLALGSEID